MGAGPHPVEEAVILTVCWYRRQMGLPDRTRPV
jgi:hypothetical protein